MRMPNGQVYQQSIHSVDPSGQVGFQFSFQGRHFNDNRIPIKGKVKQNCD